MTAKTVGGSSEEEFKRAMAAEYQRGRDEMRARIASDIRLEFWKISRARTAREGNGK